MSYWKLLTLLSRKVGEEMKNEPAFPSKYTFEMNGMEGQGEYSGMALRDYFAGQALIGYIVSKRDEDNSSDKVANWCYQDADAMLAEREKANE